LSRREQELAQKLNLAIAAAGFDPPWVRDLAASLRESEEELRSVLRKCVRQGTLYGVVRDLHYHRDSVRALARLLKDLAEQRGVVEAAEYRNAVGVGRKRTIQILEFFDRIGFTRRTREGRVLRADSSWQD